MPALLRQLKSTIKSLLAGELKISSPTGPAVFAADYAGVRAECHRQWPVEPAFRQAWDQLCQSVPHATTFTSAPWQFDAIGPNLPPRSLRLITAKRGEQLLAILPMELTPTGFLESTGHAVSDYLDPLVHPQHEREAWAAVIELVDQLWDRELKAMTLHNVRHDSPARSILMDVCAAHGLTCDQTVISNSARIKLPPTWEQYLESLDSHERKELKRKIRKAEEQAGAKLIEMDGPSWDEKKFEKAFDLIEMADATKGQWFHEHVRPLLAKVGKQLAQENRLRLLMLMVNEIPAAALLEFPSPRGPLLYNSGYDPAQKQWSPGAVMFGLALKNAIERGQQFFDLLRGKEDYKYRLGAKDDPLYRISIHRP